MDNPGLVLHHFGHIFEIFAGYYLLLGASKTFNEYFNVTVVFKNWPTNYSSISEAVKKSKQFETETFKTITKDQPIDFNDLEPWYIRTRQKSSDVKKITRKANKLYKLGAFLERQIILHYDHNNSGNASETEFYKFIRPIYIYFGILCITLLVLAGVYEKDHKENTLAIINFISLIIYLIFLFCILRNMVYLSIYVLLVLGQVKTPA